MRSEVWTGRRESVGWRQRTSGMHGEKGGRAIGAYRAGRGATLEAADDRGASSVQERARLRIGGRARGEAHHEHEAHGGDTGGVEAQRLVERPRFLPRVERRAYRAGRGAAREAADDRGASSVQEGIDCRLGAGHGEERTENMRFMSVTLEVSKLSGWLNADASCRESKGGHTVRGEVRPGRRRTTAAQAACKRDSTADWGQGTGRSARRTCGSCR